MRPRFIPGCGICNPKSGFGIAQFDTAGCPPVLGLAIEHRPLCVSDNAVALAKIKELRPDIVLLFSVWNEGHVFPRIAATFSALKELAVPRVVVMGPPPVWNGGLTKAAYDSFRPLHRMPPMYSDFRLLRAYFDFERDFRRRMPADVEYVSTWDALCENQRCRVWADHPGGALMQFDELHLTLAGAKFLATQVGKCLFPAGRKPLFCNPKS